MLKNNQHMIKYNFLNKDEEKVPANKEFVLKICELHKHEFPASDNYKHPLIL